MKKIFLFAAAVVAAMTVNAQTIAFSAEDEIAQADFPQEKVYANGNFKITITNTADGGKFLVDANKTKFGTSLEDMWESTDRLNIKGKSDSKTAVTITAPAAGKIKLYARTSGKTTGVDVAFSQYSETVASFTLVDTDAKVVKDGDSDVNIYPIKEFSVQAGDISMTFTRGMYLYAVEFVSGAQGVENVDAADKAVKTFENGQLVIIKNGVKYNALGAKF